MYLFIITRGIRLCVFFAIYVCVVFIVREVPLPLILFLYVKT